MKTDLVVKRADTRSMSIPHMMAVTVVLTLSILISFVSAFRTFDTRPQICLRCGIHRDVIGAGLVSQVARAHCRQNGLKNRKGE